MADKSALRGKWGATNHDFNFRCYNTYTEQIAKEQDAQFRAAARLAASKKDGSDPHSRKYNAAGAAGPTYAYASASHGSQEIDWGKPRAKVRSLPISGVPRPRFHNRGGDGTRRHWGSEPEPQTSMEVGAFYGKPSIFADVDYDGMADELEARGGAAAEEARAAVRAAAQPAQIAASASQDVRDDALLRAINGKRDKWGEQMYTVVNLEDSGYML